MTFPNGHSILSTTVEQAQQIVKGDKTMAVTWAYARVSTDDQILDRQLEAFEEAGIDKRHIVTEKQSGKDFASRREYCGLVGTEEAAGKLQAGDCLMIYSIDRLGRNYNEIREQWDYITHELKCDIVVLDMPLLDTRKSGKDLDGTFIADLVLQILSYVAQKERENMKKRQRGAYNAMKVDEQGRHISNRTGRPVGRQETQYPENWKEVYTAWKSGQITAVEAMKRTSLTKTTFYKLAKSYSA